MTGEYLDAIAITETMMFGGKTIDVHFIPGTFKISAPVERVRQEVEALGGITASSLLAQAAVHLVDECIAAPTVHWPGQISRSGLRTDELHTETYDRVDSGQRGQVQ